MPKCDKKSTYLFLSIIYIQQRNLALLLRAQITRSNFEQVPHVSPTPWATSQESAITRRAPKATCWVRLGCWSNNSTNSHPSFCALNPRVLHTCRVPQCSYPPHWPHHQRRLANCDWMPASYSSGQPSNSHRHPTCWVSSQWSRILPRTPCHELWTSAPLSDHPPIECKRTAPQIETPSCTCRTTPH